VSVMTDLIPKEALLSWANPGSTHALGLTTVGWDQDFAIQHGLDPRLNSSEAFYRCFHR
jgi:hypothetical protein